MEEEKYHFLERRLEGLNLMEKDSSARKTMDEVFDEKTLLTLYRLMTRGVIERIEFPLSTGKEGNVFLGTDRDGRELALKIYRTSNATYRSLARYIEDDPRFRRVKRNRRALIYEWAKKEFQNLHRYRKASLPVPEPVSVLNNVLVMSYASLDGNPAPQLRNIELDGEMVQAVFDAVADFIVRGYKEAKLVHGDLSEYNILYSDSGPLVIDVGQAVISNYAMAPAYLKRDIENIRHYFSRVGADTSSSALYRLLSQLKTDHLLL